MSSDFKALRFGAQLAYEVSSSLQLGNRPMSLRKYLLAVAVSSIAVCAPAHATVTFTGNGTTENSNATSASASFTLSGSTLTLVLTNTGGATAAQGDAITGIVFSINGSQSLSFDMTGPTCGESLPGGSFIWTSGTSSNNFDPLCGSWTSVLAASPPVPAEFGVATTGFNGEFNGGSITLGNASPNYGIVGIGTFPGTIGGSQFPFIQNQLVFQFTVTSGTFTEADITGVNFLSGTAGTAHFTGQCCTLQAPEPGSLALLGLASLLLPLGLRRGRKR
jgi:hypothetical protein